MTAPVCIDLFCGCGGLSTGLLDAGVDVRLGVDADRPSITTFDLNHAGRGSKSLQSDVRAVTGSELVERAGSEVDLLVGGPPCQPFSVAGKRQGLADERGGLVFEFVRLLDEIQPQAYIFENVPNLVTVGGGAILERLRCELGRLDYSVSTALLFAADYGVPQMRKRLFIVGARDRRDISMPPPATHACPTEDPNPTLQPYVTAGDALDDLPDVGDEEAEDVANHEPTFHSRAMLERFAGLAPGAREIRSRHDRLHRQRLAYTLRAGTGNFTPLRPIHYRHDRVLSVRECARLQSFADDFHWPDEQARVQQYRQVGNAVPPVLAQAVGGHVAHELGWEVDPALFATSGPPERVRLPLAERLARRQKYMRGGASGAVPVPAR
jgi:DNA (cytosine-5)-methyltransferase 1